MVNFFTLVLGAWILWSICGINYYLNSYHSCTLHASQQFLTAYFPVTSLLLYEVSIVPTSRQRGQALAGLRWRGPAATVNYRPVLLSERVLQNNKLQLSKRKPQGEINIGRGSQMGAWHQDGLADWLSVILWRWLWLWLDLHRSPAGPKRQRKGNPVPGGITGSPCSWGI
jgi:hypothetical protein